MTQAEQTGALARLTAIKAHLATLRDDGALVTTWDDSTAEQQLSEQNSYLTQVRDSTTAALLAAEDKLANLKADMATGGHLFCAFADTNDNPTFLSAIGDELANDAALTRQLLAAHPEQTQKVLRAANYSAKKLLSQADVQADLSSDLPRAAANHRDLQRSRRRDR